MNKKGSLDDLFFNSSQLLFVGVSILFAIVVLVQFRDVFTSLTLSSSNATYFATEGTSQFTSIAGYAVVVVFISLMIVSFIAAMKLPTSIIWTPLFAIGSLIATWASYLISISYTEIISSPTFATYSPYMTITTLIMSKLPFLVLIMGCILALATFVKYRGEQIKPL